MHPLDGIIMSRGMVFGKSHTIQEQGIFSVVNESRMIDFVSHCLLLLVNCNTFLLYMLLERKNSFFKVLILGYNFCYLLDTLEY